jgi:hypothetical protein
MGELLTGHIGTSKNIGDLAIKVIYGQKTETAVHGLTTLVWHLQ